MILTKQLRWHVFLNCHGFKNGQFEYYQSLVWWAMYVLKVFKASLNVLAKRKSSDIIGALRKILALLGEKCHAYKLKKSWQV